MYDQIPSTLKDLPQWVCVEANSKVPMRAFENVPASSVKPETWATFEDAQQSVKDGNYDNVGFVFNNNNLVGIDIDYGYDEDGFISELAADIIDHCRSYTERSRSGRGFHVILCGNLPFKGKNNLHGVEIYSAARYFIMTGDVVLYDQLSENQEAIDYVIEKYFPDVPRTNDFDSPSGNRLYVPVWERPTDGRIKLRPVYPKIPNGCRNICLTSLAGMLHNQGYSRDQIYDELLYCNQTACEPLLERSEIKSIVSSVTRYKR